ncbi:MAG: TolC family protein [Prolixibacteraceae bacterium]|nr:TolC family protein [Prolixibacteraceae bacterium]
MRFFPFRKIYFPFFILIVFGFNKNTIAQNKASKELHLNDCINLAIESSYRLQTDSLLINTLQMQVQQEQASYYPEISGSVALNGLFLSPYTFGQHFLQAVADWDLGKFWYKTHEIKQKQMERQVAMSEQNKREISSVVAGLYLDVLQKQYEKQILDARVAYLKKHLDILTVLWKAGTIQQLDILQTQSSMNSVNEKILQKNLEIGQVKYALARLMNYPSDTHFAVAPISDRQNPLLTNPQAGSNWVEQHPLSQIAQKEFEAEQLKKREVQASLLPHIQAISGYAFDRDPTGDGNYVMLGLGATIPIFRWGKTDYQLREIDFNAAAIQSNKKDIERELSIRYGQIEKQIQQYKTILDFQQEKIKTDVQVMQVAEVNYEAGLATHLDFLIAQQTLTETKLKINEVQNRYLKSVVALYLLTGQTEKINALQ